METKEQLTLTLSRGKASCSVIITPDYLDARPLNGTVTLNRMLAALRNLEKVCNDEVIDPIGGRNLSSLLPK